MDALNPALVVPRAKKLLTYMGKFEYSFELTTHGLTEVPVREHTHFHWKMDKPHVFTVYAHNNLDYSGENSDGVKTEVSLKGAPLSEFFKRVNEEAYNQAQKEYLHQSVLNYLNSQLDRYEN
jgi:hypothetical protein